MMSTRQPPFLSILPLEPRTLLAASVSDGVLTITPDRRSNIISVRATDTSGVLELLDNGALRNFSPGSVQRIVIRGGSLGDVIDATTCPVPLTVYGGRGADVLTGGDANDRLFGGPGDDRLRGGTGRDILSGEAGADSASYDDRSAPVVVTAGDGRGNDGQILAGRSEGDDVRDDVEILIGGDGDDDLHAGTARSTLFGGDGDDLLVGGDNDDVLVGQAGNDLLDGAAGNDVLIASDRSFADDLIGGPGFDIAILERRIDDASGVEFIEDD